MLRLIAEIKRRRVIPVAAYYVVGAWLVLQAARQSSISFL
jgi:delta-aminolevulinic acid dehydratase/porphobilinogen synthase